ncbi:hypothetical protein [Natrialba swarupiae]|uniref:hypothetical protein n=1 Tax=Natrialba swarupiae TaxID=2448032 RepID=UPI00192E616B|nr:hypothetical protein [Natrialba swarupiae]
MAPVAMLVGFCAVMAMIAIVRLVIDDDRDLVDVGTTSIVVAITALASWWVALEEGWLMPIERTALLAAAIAFGGIGVVLVVRYWNRTDVTANTDRIPARDTASAAENGSNGATETDRPDSPYQPSTDRPSADRPASDRSATDRSNDDRSSER